MRALMACGPLEQRCRVKLSGVRSGGSTLLYNKCPTLCQR